MKIKRIFSRSNVFFLAMIMVVTNSSCDVLGDTIKDLDIDELSESEVIEGLKEALVVGTDTSTNVLGTVNGYLKDEAVKILLPEEAQPILDNMEKLNLTGLVQPLIDQTIESINKAAEESAALDSTKIIFKDAITDMTIADGWAILNGSDTAATTYLKDKTYSRLLSNFSSIISPVLNKPVLSGVDLSTEDIYASLISTYNTGVNAYNVTQIFNPENQLDLIESSTLAEHATGKALDGLFLKVSEEEKSIREDPFARVTDILERVFGSLDN